MASSFGARLRAQRERRLVSLATIAEQTKISLSLLDALERDDVSRWPTGLFRRAFVRAYASAVGLDPETTVREFLAAHPDPAETAAVPVEGVAVPLPDAVGAPPATRLRGLVDSAVVSLGRLSSKRSTTPSAREEPIPPSEAPWTPDLAVAARLGTELGRVGDVGMLTALLGRAAAVLHGSGVIVWVWDAPTERLRPALTHGYSEAVLAHVPALLRDDDNATASVFRSGQPCVVDGAGTATGAVVAPLLGRSGCVGVLAVEVHDGAEHIEAVRALVTIFAAYLAPLVAHEQPADVVTRRAAG